MTWRGNGYGRIRRKRTSAAELVARREADAESSLAQLEVSAPNHRHKANGGHRADDAGCGNRIQTQPLWIEHMAVAMPLRFPLLDQASLTIADLQDYPIFRWRAEACSSLDHRLLSRLPADQKNLQYVTSFEMMALWVSAGYGVGVSAQSRIKRAHGWGISMRPLDDGPYEIVTHLHRPQGQANSVAERFERRALQIAKSVTS